MNLHRDNSLLKKGLYRYYQKSTSHNDYTKELFSNKFFQLFNHSNDKLYKV